MTISNIKEIYNIIYSTEILLLLFMIGGMDVHLGHVMV